MSRPVLAFLALIVIAVGIASFTTRSYHPDPLPAEKEAQEEQKQNEEKANEIKQKQEQAKAAASNPNRTAAYDAVKEGAIRVRLEIENRGTLTLELYPKAAPQTVAHFVELVKKGFYDGILVHRVEKGFVVQAGDPESKKVKQSDLHGLSSAEVGQKYHLGGGGSGKTVPLEVKLPHLAYTVGLARSNEPDSGDSQFFINLADNASLDSGYCAFGRVIDGQKIADSIEIGDRIKSMSIAQ